MTRSLALAALLASVLALPAAGKDVYKGFLDPGNPQHRATLDILERLKENPNDASLHNDLGCLIARDGFWRDALREFDIASKLDKKDGRASYNAGLVETTRGKWGAARHAFATAVDRTPGNWPAWWMLGFAEEMLGNADAAVQAYATSLRVDTSLYDIKRNPYASQTRLKARVLLETYDRRMARIALPLTEQLAQPEILTAFQTGRVAVTAAPGRPVEDWGGRAPSAGPGGGPASGSSGGAVVTAVPPVSSSRPAAPQSPSPQVNAPAAPQRSGGLEEAPPWFPQTSPAGPAPPRPASPPANPDPGAPAHAPTPAPPPPGPGVG
jgi:hypothetical protein